MGKKRKATEISDQDNSGQGRNGDAEKCCEARETLMLDQEGDVTITINCPRCDEARRFRASSRVLSLASPVFAKMLGPDFKEGQQLRKEGQVTVGLHDDDPDAAERVLCALHYHPNAKTLSIWHTQLLPMALFSDKYDCGRALAPWIMHWCKVRPSIDMTSAAYTVLAAYLFRAPNFYEITSKMAKCLSPDFASSWKKLEWMDLLPEHLMSALSTVVADTSTLLHRQLQVAAMDIRVTTGYFAMNKFQWDLGVLQNNDELRALARYGSIRNLYVVRALYQGIDGLNIEGEIDPGDGEVEYEDEEENLDLDHDLNDEIGVDEEE